MKKIYVIRKYVWAKDIKDTLKLEKECPVHEAYLETEAVTDLKYSLSGLTAEQRSGFRLK